jgi:hypothetical protein
VQLRYEALGTAPITSVPVSINHADNFGGLTLAGLSLGFLFWLNFRARFSRGGHAAGLNALNALNAGILLGALFGYQATQPGYFKALAGDHDGIRLEYYLPGNDILPRWGDIESVGIPKDRLTIIARQGAIYTSSVVYVGDQAGLLRSLTPFFSGRDSLN